MISDENKKKLDELNEKCSKMKEFFEEYLYKCVEVDVSLALIVMFKHPMRYLLALISEKHASKLFECNDIPEIIKVDYGTFLQTLPLWGKVTPQEFTKKYFYLYAHNMKMYNFGLSENEEKEFMDYMHKRNT